MTANDLKALKTGEHKVRIKGLSKTLKKTRYSSFFYQYVIDDCIHIHINPVYDTIFLITTVSGLSFERELKETELTII